VVENVREDVAYRVCMASYERRCGLLKHLCLSEQDGDVEVELFSWGNFGNEALVTVVFAVPVRG
jgi:hypothetical protein